MKMITFKNGDLTFVKKEKQKNRNYILAKCNCGNYTKVRSDSFVNGGTKSCGCLTKIVAKKQSTRLFTKHQLTKTKIYRTLQLAKERCNVETNVRFKDYGGRGIKICEDWSTDFMKFYNWALTNGYVVGLSLERVDYNKGYSPDNCIWIPKEMQARNTRNTYKIKTVEGLKTLKEFANYKKVSESGLRHFCERYHNKKEADGEELISQYLAKIGKK
ncbi:MAG: hypothetical protein ACRCW9_01990 [Cetobacterium sp.]